MSQRYTIVSSLPVNQYCWNSPILVAAGALVKDNKTGKVLVQLKFKNLSEQIITAVKVSINAFDVSGVQLEGIDTFQYLDLSALPKAEFGDDRAMPLPNSNARTCTVIINEILFANEAPWKNVNHAECSPIPKQANIDEILNDTELFEQYKRDTTIYAKYKPTKHMDLWLCSCGTANKRQDNKCSHCGIALQKLLDATNLERLQKNLKAYQENQEREADARRQAEKRKRRIGTIAASCVILVAALFFLVTNIIIPSVKYHAAEKLLETGEFENAIIAFEELEGFRDSEDRIEEAKLKIIEAERMAVEAEKASMYSSAEALLNDGQTGLAAMAFYLADDYKDARERSVACWDMVADRKNISAAVGHTAAIKSDGTVYSVGNVLHQGETIYTDSANGDWKTKDWSDIIAVSASEYNTIGLKRDGTVFLAGALRHGIESTQDVVAVSAGVDHAVVLWANGCVGASGSNSQGQCDVSNWQGIIAISAGDGFTIGLRHDGTVVATGRNSSGQCNVSNWTDVIAISAGANHTVGLKSDGTVVATGDNTYGQCNVSLWKDIVDISASDSRGLSNVIGTAEAHTVGLTSGGIVLTTGDNSKGQCDVAGWTEIVEVDAGYLYTVGLKLDGTVISVGNNNTNQRDFGDWGEIRCPSMSSEEKNDIEKGSVDYQKKMYAEAETLLAQGKTIEAAILFAKLGNHEDAQNRSRELWASNITNHTVAFGYSHIIAIKEDGTVVAAGDNSKGQCDVSTWQDIVSVAAAEYASLGLKSDGTVCVAGSCNYGSNLRDVSLWTDIVAISISDGIVGIKSDGTVITTYGIEDKTEVASWRNVIAVDTEHNHTIGLTVDGYVVGAGYSKEGQIDVANWNNVVAIATGEDYSVGLRADGTVVATGQNRFGERNVSSWQDIVDIRADSCATFGLKSNGTVVTTGNNSKGKQNAQEWNNIVAIESGPFNFAGISSDGTLIVIGDNEDGVCDASGWTGIRLPNRPKK